MRLFIFYILIKYYLKLFMFVAIVYISSVC